MIFLLAMIVASAGSSVAGTFELPPDSIVDISDSEPARSDSSGEKGCLVFLLFADGIFQVQLHPHTHKPC